jgi:hypothetical protein
MAMILDMDHFVCTASIVSIFLVSLSSSSFSMFWFSLCTCFASLCVSVLLLTLKLLCNQVWRIIYIYEAYFM